MPSVRDLHVRRVVHYNIGGSRMQTLGSASRKSHKKYRRLELSQDQIKISGENIKQSHQKIENFIISFAPKNGLSICDKLFS